MQVIFVATFKLTKWYIYFFSLQIQVLLYSFLNMFTIVNKESSLTRVNKGLWLTSVNETTHLVVFTTSNIIIYRENIKIRIFLVFLQEFSKLLQPLYVRLSSYLPKIEIYQRPEFLYGLSILKRLSWFLCSLMVALIHRFFEFNLKKKSSSDGEAIQIESVEKSFYI